MRILMVAPQPFFRPRGTPFSVLHRVRALLRLGHQVDLVTYPVGDTPALPGLVVHRARRLPGIRDVPIGPSVTKALLDIPLFVKAFALARRGDFDLLHTHEEAGFMGAWIARACRLPHLYDMHSRLPEQFANFKRFDWPPVVAAFDWMERFTLAGSDGVIAICRSLYDHVLDSGYTGPIALIENTFDFPVPPMTGEDTRRLRDRLGLDGAEVVLYTGTLEPYQGLDLLVGAAADVAGRRPMVRFVLVGGTPEQSRTLRQIVQKRGLESCFVFVPMVEPNEIFLFHRMADVLVTTRLRGSNTPLKIYQYLRAGRPIVATEVEAHTQVLDARSAELVPPTAAGVAAGILRVLANPDRARELSRNAQELASTRYSEEAYLDSLKKLLARMPVASGEPA